MEQVGVQFIAQGGDQYITTLHNATNSTNTFVDATEKGGGRVGAAGQVMIGALRQVGMIAVQAFGQALRAGADFVGDSIKLAGDFDQTMSVLRATSGATADEITAVSAKAKALGADLTLPATSAVDAGKAMLELSKAGFTVAESMDAAKGVLQLAAAAQIDEARAAEINANALNAFGLEAKDSIFVSDLLAASANASSVEITDVAQSYQMAGAVFSSFQGPVVGAKESLVQLTTAIGLLGNAGIKGSDAGTALKQSLLQLSGPSMKAKDEMRALFLATQAEGDAGQNLSLVLQGNASARAEGLRGLQESAGATAALGDIAYDAAGNMRPFPEILRLTALATKDMTAEQRDGAITTIFGADAMRAILILMKQGPDAWGAMETAVTRQGAAADLAAAQTTGYKGALEGAKSQVETLQLTIGQALTPILAELLNTYISPGIVALTNFADALLGNGEAFNKLSPDLQAVVTGIGILVGDMQNIVGAFDDAGAMSSEFGESIGLLASDLGLPGELIQDIVFAAQDLVGWFSTASDTSSDLGGVLNDLNGIWNLALKTVQDVGAGYMAIANAVLPIIQNLWKEHGTEISAFLKTTYDTVISIVRLALQLYDAIVPPILNTIAGFFRDHGSEIEKILSGAGQAIGAIVSGTMETIKGIFQLALDLIHGDWKAAWGDIEGIVSAQAKAIGGVITGFLNIIAGLFNTSLADIGKTWSDNWNSMVDLVGKIGWWEAGKSVVDGLKKGIDDAWNSLLSWFNSKVAGLVDAAMDAIGAHSPATEFMPVGAYAIQGIMQGMQGVIPSLTDLINQTGNEMIAALTKNIEEGGDKIRKELEKLTNDIKAISADISNAIADAFGATASVDRQKVANITALGKLDPKFQAGIQAQINAAEQIARAMNDPQQAAAYFKMRSQQLIELGKLQGQLSADLSEEQRSSIEANIELYQAQISSDLTDKQRASIEAKALALHDKLGLAETDEQRSAINEQLAPLLAQLDADMSQAQRDLIDTRLSTLQGQLAADLSTTQRNLLQAQYDLINDAQNAEMHGFDASAAGRSSPLQEIADQLAGLFSGSDVASKLPGILESPLVSQVFGLLDQLRNATVAPPASGYNGVGGTSNFSQSRVYNMPIYTNQSPDALAQSLAIQQAVMP